MPGFPENVVTSMFFGSVFKGVRHGFPDAALFGLFVLFYSALGTFGRYFVFVIPGSTVGLFVGGSGAASSGHFRSILVGPGIKHIFLFN